ncbi:hypothetical protein [Lysobacter enzymogenes]|uniref:hypothetical protein n=1 Tax=Lysobacter enzymogenes TaxID=69 RepID=UPI00099B5631|nr:hypothetical protein [Lysobacter enzymogenes]UZW60887.1 hypothetical protein BV903_000950 [Lysobacter enzymogenes]
MTLLHFPANRLRPRPGKAPYRAIAPLLRLACAQLRERDAADARGALVATWRRSPQSGRLECRWTRAGAAEEPPGRERMDRRDRRDPSDRRSDRRAHRDAHPLRRSEACPDVPSLPAISAGAAARALVAQRL